LQENEIAKEEAKKKISLAKHKESEIRRLESAVKKIDIK
jgi:hypothetical protein